MANARDVVVKIVGDNSSLNKALRDTEGSLGNFGATAAKVGGVLAAAFAGSQVVDFLFNAAKAAAEEEKQMAILATTLTNVTGASDQQVAANERWITSVQNSVGISDGQLRPALQNLVVATGDLTSAQDLMGEALDISVGKGLDLETVTKAMAKAHDGNTGALQKLGIQTKDVAGETLSFDEIMQNANQTFGGDAAAAADTAEGSLQKLQVRWEDLKEEIGNKVLPVMTALVDFTANKLIPTIEDIWNVLAGPGGIANTVADVFNAVGRAFATGINAIIRILNTAIATADKALGPLVNFGTIQPVKWADVGGGGGGGNVAPQRSINAAMSPSSSFLPGGVAGATAGIAGGIVPKSQYPKVSSSGGGGGGGGGTGGKSAAEMQLEADNKAIAATLTLWANAREHQREIEDNMYEDEKTAAEDYLKILEKRLAGEEQFSDAWMAIERDITSVKKDIAAKQKAIDDKKTKDAKEAAAEQLKLAEAAHKAETDRLDGMSDQEIAEYLYARQQGSGQQILYSQLGTDIAAGKYAPNDNTSQVSTNPNYGNTFAIQNVNVTANNPDQLVAALNDYARRNGGLRVPGGVVAV